MAIGRIFCTALLALTAASHPAEKPTIAVSPRVALAPLDILKVTARIPQLATNRAFCVTVEIDDMTLRRTCRELEGDQADVTYESEWRGFYEPGDYVIALTVLDNADHTYRVSTPFTLRGGPHDSDRDRIAPQAR